VVTGWDRKHARQHGRRSAGARRLSCDPARRWWGQLPLSRPGMARD